MTATPLADRADADLLLAAVYDAYHDVDPRIRDRHVWVMDPLMRQLLRRLAPAPSSGYLWPPPPVVDGQEIFMGLPAEIREDAWGIRLEDRP